MQLVAAITAWSCGEPVNVTAACRKARMSPKTFYKWAARYKAEGLAGLEERSRRPHSNPNRTPADIEAAVLAEHSRLVDSGQEHGAKTIQWHLGKTLGNRVPSESTIYRMLVRAGRIVPAPQKRPKRSRHRFEAAAPNERWQIDATDVTIATGVVRVFNVLDDHSRLLVASRAVAHATSEEAWTTFCQAAQQWGVPAAVLSDNGLCFSGKLRGFEVLFEYHLREAGVRPMTGRPYHPQTTGKIERFHQSLKKWLDHQPLAADLAALQAQLDTHARIYNHDRPHQGIGRRTPIERWHAGTPASPADTPLDHPVFPAHIVRHLVVDTNGTVQADEISIGIGARYAGATVTVLIDDHYASVFHDSSLIRHLLIDRSRRYQPLRTRRGGPRHPRVAS